MSVSPHAPQIVNTQIVVLAQSRQVKFPIIESRPSYVDLSRARSVGSVPRSDRTSHTAAPGSMHDALRLCFSMRMGSCQDNTPS